MIDQARKVRQQPLMSIVGGGGDVAECCLLVVQQGVRRDCAWDLDDHSGPVLACRVVQVARRATRMQWAEDVLRR